MLFVVARQIRWTAVVGLEKPPLVLPHLARLREPLVVDANGAKRSAVLECIASREVSASGRNAVADFQYRRAENDENRLEFAHHPLDKADRSLAAAHNFAGYPPFRVGCKTLAERIVVFTPDRIDVPSLQLPDSDL